MKSPEATKILLINPPHTAIGSRIPKEQLPPLGLLRIGESLVEAGFEVALLDAGFGSMSLFDIVRSCRKQAPRYVMLGHTACASLHATMVVLSAMLKFAMPNLVIIYGGEFSSTMSPLNSVDAYPDHGKTPTSSNSPPSASHYPSRYRRQDYFC